MHGLLLRRICLTREIVMNRDLDPAKITSVAIDAGLKTLAAP